MNVLCFRISVFGLHDPLFFLADEDLFGSSARVCPQAGFWDFPVGDFREGDGHSLGSDAHSLG